MSFCGRATLWQLGFSLFAALIMIAAAVLAKSFPLGSPVRIALAVVQGAASTAVILLAVRSIRRLDELQQRIHLEAMLLAFAGTGILATAYGFLQNAGLPPIDWGGLVWPAMAGLWAAGFFVANRRYR